MSRNGNERTRILSHLLLVCLLIGAIPIAHHVVSENTSDQTSDSPATTDEENTARIMSGTPATKIWNRQVGDLASDDRNWAVGTSATKAVIPTTEDAAAIGIYQGNLYVAGGYPSGLKHYIYYPGNNTWNDWPTDLPAQRWDSEGVVIGQYFYVIGGSSDTNAFNTTYRYDLINGGAWVAEKNATYGRAKFGASVHDGKIYCFASNWVSTHQHVEVYDPGTNLWTTKNECPIAVCAATEASIDGYIYLLCIRAGTGYPNNFYRYNPVDDTYTAMADMNYPGMWWSDLQLMTIGSKIYSIAGGNESSGKIWKSNKSFEYDISLNSWKEVSPAYYSRIYSQKAVNGSGVYLVGGRAGNGDADSGTRYNYNELYYPGSKPVTGDNIVFNSTSIHNCTWDMATWVGDVSILGSATAGWNFSVNISSTGMNVGGNLAISSADATRTVTLTHYSDYQLTVNGSVVLGDRGIMTQGTGAWTFGSYTQNGASSVFTEGGNVVIGTDFSQSLGTFTGTTSVTYATSVGGNFTKTGGTLTSESMNLNMTGVGTISVDTAQLRFFKITIQGSTTYASGGQQIWPRHFNGGTVVTGTLSISYGMTWRANQAAPFTNTGTITGLGTIEFATDTSLAQTITFGTINCQVLIDHVSTAGVNGILNLGSNTVLGSNLTISGGIGITMTLAHNSNYQLTVAGNVTLGDRGIMTQGTGAWTFGSYTQNGASSVFTQAGDVTVNGGVLVSAGTFTQSSNRNWTVNVSGVGVVFGVTGGLMRLANNMTINPGCSASLLNNSFVMNQVVNSGAIIQNGKRLNITGSSTTPLTGYGTFDGDLYLNGSVASSYEIQTNLSMGTLHTDRDTKVSISPTQYLRVSPEVAEFVSVSINSYGSEAGIAARWNAESTGPVIYTIMLAPNQLYETLVDQAVKIGAYQADSDGVVQFTYNGPFSSHEFTLQDVRSLPCTLWASFTYSIDGLKVEFIDTTYTQSSMTIWNFGDGFGSRNPYPTHTYQNSGTYQVSMMAYDEYGHYNTAQTTITVELGPSTPLEHTGTGWNIYLGNGTVIGISAAGLLISGALSLVSSWYIPDIPIITIRARRLYGVLAILAALYFALFVKGVNIGGF